ncbi:Spindolin [Vibrio cholerae]|nr:Spindolin [Vibrio cholerae]TQP01740.1 Spindolin [Vibrio cholerae]TQP62402.1 Spindolin [Vibrio cholerae]TQP97062.1 Spindolin [Vibrio cholerae]
MANNKSHNQEGITMKYGLKISALGSVMLGALAASQVQAHGWVEFPSARQNTCYLDGGFWDNAIPNQACQAAYDVSGAFPFVQRNEISANVQKYRDMAAVKAVVKDGELCSAGDKAKAGLNVPSAHWQKTGITLDANGQIEVVFHAATPHNPSYWQFYLSKATYDHTKPLTWDDLALVGSSDDVAAGSDKKYRFKVTLPQDRSGDAILYTRWQRVDAGGEGFYNCSDITFGGATTPPDPTDPTDPVKLTALGYYVPQGFGPVEVGDSVRLRTFDATGMETTDIALPIRANNLETWPAELAGQFNQLKNGEWFIGIWHQEMNHYMFDTQNLYANQVFAPNSNLTYRLSLTKGDTTPPTQPENAWDKSKTYTAGAVVTHKGKSWTAQWWTQGEEPGTTGEWGVWR